MGSGRHIGDILQAYLAGALPAGEREHAAAHLDGCPQCREERDLLQAARALVPALPEREPRAGFAASVALAARDGRVSPFAQWLRWSLGGLAVAGAAALAVTVALPSAPARRSDELMLAQRIDLFEDMTVMQNQEALEDLDVVEVLHTLQQEARP
jgi:anti-sigma factor RsiW